MCQKIQEQKMKVPVVEAKTSLGVAQADNSKGWSTLGAYCTCRSDVSTS